jgi:hypothetical protein
VRRLIVQDTVFAGRLRRRSKQGRSPNYEGLLSEEAKPRPSVTALE